MDLSGISNRRTGGHIEYASTLSPVLDHWMQDLERSENVATQDVS